MNSTLTVVIVNYRTAGLVCDCLQSLEPQLAKHDAHVIVVDNDSGDESEAHLRETIAARGWSAWTTLIASPCNDGFSSGNNIGIRARDSRWYLLLNPDTVVKSGAIAEMLAFMRSHPRAGIVGCFLEGPDGVPQGSARRCPTPISELDAAARTGPISRVLGRWAVSLRDGQQRDPIPCDWVSGAAMCIRREVFDEIGLFDEGYFLYYEELDFCERARRAPGRWEVWLVPRSRIIHLEGASTGTMDDAASRPKCWYDSRRRFFLKRHGLAGLLCADALWSVGRVMFSVRSALTYMAGAQRAQLPRCAARHLLLGDARAIASGEALRIVRESRMLPSAERTTISAPESAERGLV